MQKCMKKQINKNTYVYIYRFTDIYRTLHGTETLQVSRVLICRVWGGGVMFRVCLWGDRPLLHQPLEHQLGLVLPLSLQFFLSLHPELENLHLPLVSSLLSPHEVLMLLLLQVEKGLQHIIPWCFAPFPLPADNRSGWGAALRGRGAGGLGLRLTHRLFLGQWYIYQSKLGNQR